ncbi:MAG: zeta toxin family protein [Proteobacteria bacterium]|nr:zeta toxin family protein [Pseudomonadota bacterium]
MKHIVLIAGGSGSGKTTLSKILKDDLRKDGKKVLRIPMDAYYKTKADREKRENPGNMDCSDAFDLELLKNHLGALMRGESIKRPYYKMSGKTSDREEKFKLLSGNNVDVIVIEGILGLHKDVLDELQSILSDSEIKTHKVFVDMDYEAMLEQRIIRDAETRGATREDTIEFDTKFVRPAYNTTIKPTKNNADSDKIVTNCPSELGFYKTNKHGEKIHAPVKLVEEAEQLKIACIG